MGKTRIILFCLLVPCLLFGQNTRTYTVGTGGGSGCGGSCDYSSMSAAEVAHQQDLVAADSLLTFEFYDDGVMTDDDSFTNWTMDATRYLQLTVASGERHDGTFGNGFRMLSGGSDTIRPVDGAEFLRVAWIAFDSRAAFAAVTEQFTSPASGAVMVIEYVLVDSGAFGGDQFILNDANTIFRLKNCIAINSDDEGFNINAAAAGSQVYNCTSVNADGNGFQISDADVTIRNCLSLLSDTNDFSFTNSPTRNNNASEDGTADGTNSINTLTAANQIVSVANNSEDIHVLNTSADIYQAGADLDGDSTLPVTDDIDEEPRNATTPDIGADETTVVAGSARRKVLVF